MASVCFASALTVVTAVAQSTYQLPNIGFENWESAKGAINWTEKNAGQSQPGKEPTSWYSSNIKYTSGSFELIQEKNANGHHYANIINKLTGQGLERFIPFLGVLSVAPSYYVDYGSGNGLLGSRVTNAKYAQNGVYGGVSFVGRPDAVEAVIQLDAVDEAHIIAYLWKGTYKGEVPGALAFNTSGNIFNRTYTPYIKSWLSLDNLDRAIWSQIDPSIVTSETVQNISKTDDAEIIAYCDQKYTSNFSWTTVEIPLTYLSTSTPEMTNVILAAGYPWDSRKVTAEKSLNVDSVRYVYYSRLKSASISGYDLNFNSNTYDYKFTVEDPTQVELPETVDYTVMSNDALVDEKTVTVTRDDANKIISVKVANNAYAAGNTDATDVDGLGEHTYSIYFRKPAETITGYYFTNVDSASSDIASGEQTTLKLEQNKASLDSYTATISNVKVAEGADAVNLVFSDVTVTEENDERTFSGTGNATVGDETVKMTVTGTIAADGTFEIHFSYVNAANQTVLVVLTPDAKTSGVVDAKAVAAVVSASNGKISVVSYTGNVEVYTIDGRLVANEACQLAADIDVPNGLYIVRTGNKTTKVVVK